MVKTPEFYAELVSGMPYFRKSKWEKMLQSMTAEWLWSILETKLHTSPWEAFAEENLKQDLNWDRSRYDQRLNHHFDAIVKAQGLNTLKDVMKWLSREDISINTGVRVANFHSFPPSAQIHDFFWDRPKQNSWVVLSTTRTTEVVLPLLDFNTEQEDFADVETHRPQEVVAATASAISYQLRMIWEKALVVAPELKELEGAKKVKEIEGFLEALMSKLFGVIRPKIRFDDGKFEWVQAVEVEITYSVPNKIVYTKRWQQHYLTPIGAEKDDPNNRIGVVTFGPRALRHIGNEVLARFVASLWQINPRLDAEIKVKDLKARAKEQPGMQSLMSRPEVREYLKSIAGREFTIQEVIDYSMTLPVPEKAQKCSELALGRDIRISYDEWAWPYQRAVTSGKDVKHPIKNYVLRLEWVSAPRYLTKEKIISLQQDMRAKTFHPNTTTGDILTFGWVRYTIWKKQGAVVLDEIQTDLGPVLKDLGFNGWAEKVGWYFLAFSFQHLKHDHVLIPDLKTKVNVYKSRLPEALGAALYEKLPPRLGATGKVTLKVKGQPADFWLIPNPSRQSEAK